MAKEARKFQNFGQFLYLIHFTCWLYFVQNWVNVLQVVQAVINVQLHILVAEKERLLFFQRLAPNLVAFFVLAEEHHNEF